MQSESTEKQSTEKQSTEKQGKQKQLTTNGNPPLKLTESIPPSFNDEPPEYIPSLSSSQEGKYSLSMLDDESLLIISDIIENSVIPAFLDDRQNTETLNNKNAAIDVFVSRLPDGLAAEDFQKIKALFRDYLPYDIADNLAKDSEEKYRLNEQEQIYLSRTLQSNTLPETMERQIEIAKHLESLKGEQQETKINTEPSQAHSDWQKTQEKLKKIQSSSDTPEQDIYDVLEEEYGAQVADDYLELSNTEKEWQEKYAIFLAEKNIISESGLSDEDKSEQIESLIQQHYDESEWAAVRAYDEMM